MVTHTPQIIACQINTQRETKIKIDIYDNVMRQIGINYHEKG